MGQPVRWATERVGKSSDLSTNVARMPFEERANPFEARPRVASLTPGHGVPIESSAQLLERPVCVGRSLDREPAGRADAEERLALPRR